MPSPTEEELSTIADYILWGKRNGEKDRAFQIEPRNKNWVRNREESLETLQMSLTFNEGELSRPGPAYTRPNPVFSRENARAMAPASLLPEFEALWRTIDQLDIRIRETQANCACPPRAINPRRNRASTARYRKLEFFLLP